VKTIELELLLDAIVGAMVSIAEIMLCLTASRTTEGRL